MSVSLALEGRDKRISRADWSVSLADKASFRFHEKSILNSIGQGRRDKDTQLLAVTSTKVAHADLQTLIHVTHTNTYFKR